VQRLMSIKKKIICQRLQQRTDIKSKILEEIIGRDYKHAQELSTNALLRHSIFVLCLMNDKDRMTQ